MAELTDLESIIRFTKKVIKREIIHGIGLHGYIENEYIEDMFVFHLQRRKRKITLYSFKGTIKKNKREVITKQVEEILKFYYGLAVEIRKMNCRLSISNFQSDPVFFKILDFIWRNQEKLDIDLIKKGRDAYYYSTKNHIVFDTTWTGGISVVELDHDMDIEVKGKRRYLNNPSKVFKIVIGKKADPEEAFKKILSLCKKDEKEKKPLIETFTPMIGADPEFIAASACSREHKKIIEEFSRVTKEGKIHGDHCGGVLEITYPKPYKTVKQLLISTKRILSKLCSINQDRKFYAGAVPSEDSPSTGGHFHMSFGPNGWKILEFIVGDLKELSPLQEIFYIISQQEKRIKVRGYGKVTDYRSQTYPDGTRGVEIRFLPSWLADPEIAYYALRVVRKWAMKKIDRDEPVDITKFKDFIILKEIARRMKKEKKLMENLEIGERWKVRKKQKIEEQIEEQDSEEVEVVFNSDDDFLPEVKEKLKRTFSELHIDGVFVYGLRKSRGNLIIAAQNPGTEITIIDPYNFSTELLKTFSGILNSDFLKVKLEEGFVTIGLSYDLRNDIDKANRFLTPWIFSQIIGNSVRVEE